MGYLLVVIVVFALIVFLYMRQEKFGASPKNDFSNIEFTPDLSPGYGYFDLIKMQFTEKSDRAKPAEPIPSITTDLKSISEDQDVLVWFGHSSYYIQYQGVKILMDPVFSGSASPLPWSIKAFEGTDLYQAEDFPELDYIIISHDHYDHLDYKTIKAFQSKTKKVITGKGVGSHFLKWGYQDQQIIETQWWETLKLNDSTTISTAPTRHFSGRGFKRNNTLWQSYVLNSSKGSQIYLGGDSGYGSHFKQIHEKHGDMDLVILDNGQYNDAWKAIHMHPDQVIQATKDLGAKRLFPVHSSKFVLALHAWDEPLIRTSSLAHQDSIPVVSPRIGEIVRLDDYNQQFTPWWEDLN